MENDRKVPDVITELIMLLFHLRMIHHLFSQASVLFCLFAS